MNISYTDAIVRVANYNGPLDKIDKSIGDAILAGISKDLQIQSFITRRGEAILIKAWDERNRREVAAKVVLREGFGSRDNSEDARGRIVAGIAKFEFVPTRTWRFEHGRRRWRFYSPTYRDDKKCSFRSHQV